MEALLRDSFGVSTSDLRQTSESSYSVLSDSTFYVASVASQDRLSLLSSALLYAHKCNKNNTVTLPKILRSRNATGDAVVRVGETESFAMVVEQLEGVALAPNFCGQLTVQQLRDLGRFRGQLLCLLRGFLHRGLLLSGAESGNDENAGFRSQALVGGADPLKTVLVDGENGLAVGSFDVVEFGPVVLDLARTLASYLQSEDFTTDLTKEALTNITVGFASLLGVEESEADRLFDLVVASLQTIGKEAVAATLLQDRAGVHALLRSACGYSSQPLKDIQSPEILRRRREVLGNRLRLFYDPKVLHTVRGEGVWLYDAHGKRYLDCYNNVVSIGHCHPYVVQKVREQVRRLNTNTRYLTEESMLYAERLIATMGQPQLNTVVFVNSGSEANDVAYRISKVWTGCKGGLTMEHGYHGISDAIAGFTPAQYRAAKLPDHMRTIPPPDELRGPLKGCTDPEKFAALADEPIASLKASPHGLACCMIDSCFMSNGVLNPPKGYLQGIVRRVQQAGGLYIADEVQAGFGRTGTAMWGFQHHGLVPDMVTIGKPAGNGIPLGAVILRRELLDKFNDHYAFFSTFGGSNVSCVAGLAVLDVVENEKLVQSAGEVGAYFRERLSALIPKYKHCGSVRGIGLAIGMEIVRDKESFEPNKELCMEFLRIVRDEGVLCGSDGPYDSAAKIRPPIAFKKEHVDIAVAAIEKALQKIEHL